jgi:hypothetical protein
MTASDRVEVGDLFQDLDKRHPSPRVVRVVYTGLGFAKVENVEHWNEKIIGRKTFVETYRLLTPHRFRRISR